MAKRIKEIVEAPPSNEIQVFEDFSDKEVRIISKFSDKKFYQRDEVVFKEKSEDASLYVVLKGQLEAIAHTSEGKEISLSKIDEGEVFGELSFLDGKMRSATILAVTDVELLQISREDFESLRLDHPSIASKLILDLARVVSLRLRNADKFIVDIFQLINNEEENSDSGITSIIEQPVKKAEKKVAKKETKEKLVKAKTTKTKVKVKKVEAKVVKAKKETAPKKADKKVVAKKTAVKTKK